MLHVLQKLEGGVTAAVLEDQALQRDAREDRSHPTAAADTEWLATVDGAFAGLAEIMNSDPLPVDELLPRRVLGLITAIGGAWTSDTLDDAKTLISMDLADAWRKARSDQEAQHRVDATRMIDLRTLQFISATADATAQSVDVQLVTTGCRFLNNDRNNRRIAGSEHQTTWTTTWTLRRATPGTYENITQCPHCGAAVTENPDGRCTFCDAQLSAASKDWTVVGVAGTPTWGVL